MTDNNHKPRFVVILPTYNEAGSIGDLIDVLCGSIIPSATKWRGMVVVVDDASPDGTADIVRQRMSQYSDTLRIISRPAKSGIGSAYMDGFDFAVNKLGADVVFEFDADFQHPPEMIPVMLAKFDEGYDYIVGSRKIPGGGETADRGFWRSFLTGFGGFLARAILFFPGPNFKKVTDPTTGLKLTRVRGFLDGVNFTEKRLYNRGFGYKVQLFSEIVTAGAKYAEVPLMFHNRRNGHSKMNKTAIADVLRSCVLARLAQPATQRFAKFAIIGFTGYVINAVLLYVFARFISAELVIWLLATEVAVINNFFWNNHWTFRDRIAGHWREYLRRFLRFNATSAGSILIQSLAGTGLVLILGASYRQFILVAVILVIIVPYNWFMYNRVIWRKY